MKRNLLILLLPLILLFSRTVYAENGEGDFNPGEMITHHITDAYDWHFFDIDGQSYSIYLPVIIYSADRGELFVFSSRNFHHGEQAYKGFVLDHGNVHPVDEGEIIYDFSITKNVASMMISVLLLIIIFIVVANRYKKNGVAAPKGIQSFFEPIILYIRDDVAIPSIGEKHYRKYMPYLLTIFFFIWFNNLLGLIPAAANVTGNIAVTLILAIFTFIITQFSGNKEYWKHVFWTPGVPTPLKIIIVPIEFVGLFIKPFSLMVRLFANITAGHIVILSFLGLIFLFETVWASLISIPFAVFMMFLELFVAILQAYIFTLLSAIYFGGAVEEHHHEEDDADPALY